MRAEAAKTGIMNALAALALMMAAAAVAGAGQNNHSFVFPQNNSYINSTNFTVEVYHGFAQNASCNLYLNDTIVKQYIPAGNTTEQNLSAGEGSYILTDTCLFFNSSQFSEAKSAVVIDTTKPQIEVLPQPDNSTYTAENRTLNLTVRVNEEAIVVAELENATLESGNKSAWAELNESAGMKLSIILEQGKDSASATITARDRAGNTQTRTITITASSAGNETAGSCANGVRDPGEEDVDCGGGCGPCIPYDILIDREEFIVGEQVDITVVGRDESNHTITITGPGFFFTTQGSGIAGYFMFPEQPGKYTVRAEFSYMGATREVEKNFTAVRENTLEAHIKASPATAAPGEAISFEAVVEGGSPPYRYEWDFNQDYSTDNTDRTASYSYSSTGTKLVTLKVNDSEGNSRTAERYIHVKNKHKVTFKVVENVTGKNVTNAQVELSEENRTTDERGSASFEVFEGTYPLVVSKEQYESYEGEVSVDKNKTIVVVLNRIIHDVRAPEIEIISPYDEQEFQGAPITVRYRVSDESRVWCTEEAGEYSNLFSVLNSNVSVESNATREFVIQTAGEGKNYFRITCRDVWGNRREVKQSYTLPETKKQEESGKEQGEETSAVSGYAEESRELLLLEQDIRDLENSLQYYGKNEQKLIESLGLREKMSKLAKRAKQLSRDLFNLQYRKINEGEKEEEKKRILRKAEELKSEAVASVKVNDWRTTITYPTAQETELFAMLYLKALNRSNDKKFAERFIEETKELQTAFTASATMFQAELTYMDNTTKAYTVIRKEFNVKANKSDVVIVELIPKSLAEAADGIEFTKEVRVVDNDPIVELGADQKELTYMIEGFKNLSDAETAKSFIVYKELPERKRGLGITGFGIKLLGNAPGSKKNILIAVLLALAAYLVFYHFEVVEIKAIKDPKETAKRAARVVAKKVLLSKKGKRVRNDLVIAMEYLEEHRTEKARKEMESIEERWRELSEKEQSILEREYRRVRRELIRQEAIRAVEEAKKFIAEGSIESAKESFRDARELLKDAEGSVRDKLKNELREIAGLINRHYIDELTRAARRHLENGEVGRAAQHYKKLKILFESGNKELKMQTHKALKELAGAIHEMGRKVGQDGSV